MTVIVKLKSFDRQIRLIQPPRMTLINEKEHVSLPIQVSGTICGSEVHPHDKTVSIVEGPYHHPRGNVTAINLIVPTREVEQFHVDERKDPPEYETEDLRDLVEVKQSKVSRGDGIFLVNEDMQVSVNHVHGDGLVTVVAVGYPPFVVDLNRIEWRHQ